MAKTEIFSSHARQKPGSCTEDWLKWSCRLRRGRLSGWPFWKCIGGQKTAYSPIDGAVTAIESLSSLSCLCRVAAGERIKSSRQIVSLLCYSCILIFFKLWKQLIGNLGNKNGLVKECMTSSKLSIRFKPRYTVLALHFKCFSCKNDTQSSLPSLSPFAMNQNVHSL